MVQLSSKNVCRHQIRVNHCSQTSRTLCKHSKQNKTKPKKKKKRTFAICSSLSDEAGIFRCIIASSRRPSNSNASAQYLQTTKSKKRKQCNHKTCLVHMREMQLIGRRRIQLNCSRSSFEKQNFQTFLFFSPPTSLENLEKLAEDHKQQEHKMQDPNKRKSKHSYPLFLLLLSHTMLWFKKKSVSSASFPFLFLQSS